MITENFRLLQELTHKKTRELDAYRQFQWNSIAGIKQEALVATQSEILESQLEAASQRAQTAAHLASGIIGLILGAIFSKKVE